MNPVDIQIGGRLRELRRTAYRGMHEVAHDIGVDYDTLHRLEAGEERVSPEQLIMLSRLYGATLADIYADAHASASHPEAGFTPPGTGT